MKKPGDELSDDACIALALIAGAYIVDGWGERSAAVCPRDNDCFQCRPRIWEHLGHKTKGAAARFYCENHGLFATSGETPWHHQTPTHRTTMTR